MSELLNSGKVGLTTYRTQAEQRKQSSKIGNISLLEGLKGNHKSNIAYCLKIKPQIC